MTDKWTNTITSNDFTACIEFMSLLEFADAWLYADRRASSAAEPIRALSRARKLLVHTKPESPIIKRLMRNEWLHSRYARAALTSEHPNTLMDSIPTSEIKKHLLSRPSFGLLLDLDSRLGRSGLFMLEASQIIADSDTYNHRRHDQARRLLRRAESLLSLDFNQIVLRVSAVSERLILSEHRRWDYSQTRIDYWDNAFALQRKLLKLLRNALTGTGNSANTEYLKSLYGNIIATACDITNFELEGARKNLLFHFSLIVA